MANRNAANFPTVSTGRHYKRPKTKGEEFLDYLNSVGFPTQKYSKPEHYEHLFQKEESGACLRFLMKNIKTTNIVDKEEINRFRTLETDGKMLYGNDLKAAFTKNAEKKRLKIEKNESRLKRKAELEALINAKKENIGILELVEKRVVAEISLKNKERSAQSVEHEALLRKYEFLVEKIEKQTLELEEITSSLEFRWDEIMVRLGSSGAGVEGPEEMFLCHNQRDFTRIIADEEVLIKRVRHIVENLGTGLITREHDELNPVVVEEMNKLFNENIKEIDRLKHVIIYEAVKNISLLTTTTVKTQIAEKKLEIIAESKRISSQDRSIQKRIRSEIAHKTDLMKKSAADLRKQRMNEVKTNLNKNFDEQIQGLKDIKKMAKKRVDKFLNFVIEILASQRCRFEFGGFALKYKAGKGGHLLKSYQKYIQEVQELKEAQHSEDMNIVEQMLSFQHPGLYEAFKAHNIPILALKSQDSALKALREAQYLSSFEKFKQLEANEKYVQDNLKQLYLIQSEWNKCWDSNRKEVRDNAEEKLIQNLETNIAANKAQLQSQAINKDKIREDAISRKLAKCEKVKELLNLVEQEPSKTVSGRSANSSF